MILAENIGIKTEVSQELKTKSFGVDDATLGHIFKILREMYSDPIKAIIREITCNAVDSHTAAGKKDTPVEVHLPNAMSPYFKVRDHGVGLSEDNIFDILCMYGASTKRQSNDETGCFGLGSKSPFCYTSSFDFIGYKNGIKVTCNAYIDETGKGKIVKIHEEPTTEVGVEVVIPVKNADFPAWSQKAAEVYAFFTVRPTVKGNSAYQIADKKETAFKGEDWEITGNGYNSSWNCNSFIVMANVGYPLSERNLKFAKDDDRRFADYLINAGVYIHVPNGSMSIVPSRDALVYDDKSRTIIADRIMKLRKEFVSIVEKNVSAAKTQYEAKKVLYTGLGGYPMRNIMSSVGKINWNGIDISSNECIDISKFVEKHKVAGFAVTYYSKRRHSALNKSENNTDLRLSYESGDKFFYHDGPEIKTRIRDYSEKNNCRLWVFKFPTDACKTEFFALNIVSEHMFQNLTSLPIVKVVRSNVPGASSGTVYNSKNNKKVYQYNVNSSKAAWKDMDSDDWVPYTTTDEDEGLAAYVPILSYRLVNCPEAVTASSGSLRRIYEYIKKFYDKDFKIIGIRPSDIKTHAGDIPDLKKYMLDKFKDVLVKQADELQLHHIFSYSNNWSSAVKINIKSVDAGFIKNDRSLSYLQQYQKDYLRLQELYFIMETLHNYNGVGDKNIGDMWKANRKDKTNLEEVIKEFNKKYPMISMLSTHTYDDKCISHYINCVNRAEKNV